MDQASGLRLSIREEISSNIFLFFNYEKKSGFYYGILLDFEAKKENFCLNVLLVFDLIISSTLLNAYLGMMIIYK